jgi:hypothetical protein
MSRRSSKHRPVTTDIRREAEYQGGDFLREGRPMRYYKIWYARKNWFPHGIFMLGVSFFLGWERENIKVIQHEIPIS